MNSSNPLLTVIAGLGPEKRAVLSDLLRSAPEPIAVIGMGCRFPPDAATPDAFWDLLSEGRDGIGEVPADRWDMDAIYDPAPAAPGKSYVRRGGFLTDIASFDAGFFGISPREALCMDPQQRLLLEVTWEALEYAGLPPQQLAGSATGVFVGIMEDLYAHRELRADPDSINDPYFPMGTSCSAAAGRIAYHFDFQGPTIALDTACSSSLVTVALACQSLRNRDCDLALAGGVNTVITPEVLVTGCKTQMLAPDGRCKTFDASADGYGMGEGCGMIVLKRLAEARADGDPVLAIIHGAAINEDGRSNGLTAPNGLAQQAVIKRALAGAQIEPRLVSYVEAHGSGTPLGDPIEIEALQQVLNVDRSSDHPLYVGTVKTNLGHLVCAAGIAGMIKTILGLQHRAIPPHLNLSEGNPMIPWQDDLVRVPTSLIPWEPVQERRIAGVSSFGWAGTNAHVIVEEAEPVPSESSTRPWQLLLLSARTGSSLDAASRQLAGYLRKPDAASLADVSYTLQVGRNAFAERRALVCQDPQDAAEALETLDPRRVLTGSASLQDRPVTFMFPGLGDQYPGLAANLYRDERVFREQVDRCCELLLPYVGADLRTVLFPDSETGVNGTGGDRRDLRALDREIPGTASMEQTALAQPALFVLEYALAHLWMSWGVRPQALIGYSLGEYVAACLAGVLSLEDALRLVARRAQLIDALPPGGMLAIALPEDRVREFLDGNLSISAVNGPLMTVVAGTAEEIERLHRGLGAEGIACRPLRTRHAFHSAQMEPVLPSFRQLVGAIELRAPSIPYISNVTGAWITPEQAQDPEYWVEHLRQTVRFADGIQTAWQQPGAILLEVGPGGTLGSLALQHPARHTVTDPLVLSSLPSQQNRQPALPSLLRALGQLWLAGARLDWRGFWADEERRRVPLPTYCFERQRYWPEWVETASPAHNAGAPGSLPVPARQTIDNWFYAPAWQTAPLLPGSQQPARRNWLLLLDDRGVGRELAERLAGLQLSVTMVSPGTSFRRIHDDEYTIDFGAREDYAALLRHLYLINQPPEGVIHLSSLRSIDDALDGQTVERSQRLGFYSVLFLAQALANQPGALPTHLWLVSNNAHAVLGDDIACPDGATLLGVQEVLSNECPHLSSSIIDLDLRAARADVLADQLLAEVLSGAETSLVAYRGRSRWSRSFELIRLDAELERQGAGQLRQGGVYLITGGFGGLGGALAEALARQYAAKLVLVGRAGLPPREDWDDILAGSSDDAGMRRRIEQVLALEAAGAEVLALSADIGDRTAVAEVIESTRERFGKINGVFHLAGVPGHGLIQFKEAEAAARVLWPKVQGTMALTSCLETEPIDFMVLYSSINAIIGGLGEVDYCAANAFLDAFAHYQRSRSSIPTVSINWGLWQWDAWQSSLLPLMPEVYEQVEQLRREHGITPAEGAQALCRVLGTPLAQAVVTPLTLDAVRQSWSALTSIENLTKARTAPDRPRYPRPALRTPYVPPRCEAEEKIAAVWAEALAIDQIGIHDHFFELGGNSLLSLVIVDALEREFEIPLSAAVLYEGPTVSALADLLQPKDEREAVLAGHLERGRRRKELRDRPHGPERNREMRRKVRP